VGEKNILLFKIGVCKRNRVCNNDCNLLHICEHEIKWNGCKRFCRFPHTLETEHNKNVLQINDIKNIDFILLIRFLQVTKKNI
jgi:hypothetical protein